MIALAQKIDELIEPLRRLSDKALSPLLDLGIRLFTADIFLGSGWLKFKNFLDGNWDTTVYLFREVHIVPVVSPELAAFLGTGAEIVLPVLLIAGLFTRFSAAGLLIMTAVIQFAVFDSFGDDLSNPDHYMWMLLLAVPLIKGAGVLSLDHLVLKYLRKGEENKEKP